MKKIAAEFEPTEDVTRFYCSSDPASLDAIVLHTSKAIICDGTAPHVMECSYPGVCQKIINLGEYWDEEKLKAFKSEIIEVTDKNKSLLARSKGLPLPCLTFASIPTIAVKAVCWRKS